MIHWPNFRLFYFVVYIIMNTNRIFFYAFSPFHALNKNPLSITIVWLNGKLSRIGQSQGSREPFWGLQKGEQALRGRECQSGMNPEWVVVEQDGTISSFSCFKFKFFILGKKKM